MQHCQFCGQELPENARFCGNCGRVPVPANQSGVSMAQGTPSAGRAPAANPAPPFSVPPSSQRPQFQPPFSQPMSENNAQPPQTPQFQAAPFQSQQAGWNQNQAPAQFQPAQPQQFPQSPTPANPPKQQAASKGALPGWLLIALIAVVVIAIGGGAFALLHRGSNNGTPPSQANSGTTSNPATKFTPVSSCIANASRSANLTFSGEVSGDMVISSFMGCGPVNYSGQQGYVGNASGTIGGANYTFIFAALAYNGPGTYTFPKAAATLNRQGNAQKSWAIDPSAHSTITINGDNRSGTLDLHLFDSTNFTARVTVTGTWSGN